MVVGFVLIGVSTNKEKNAFEELKSIPEVSEIHPLFGEYDFIAKLEARDFDHLGAIIIDRIRKVPGVVETKTLTGVNFL